MNPLQPEVVVIGASLGGVLAAWRAAQAGCKVLLVAEHPWIGGQFTSQAVPPDEHGLIEFGGASASYLAFRTDMRRLYQSLPGFLDRAGLTPGCNPGDGWVSRLCIEPQHAVRWFEALLSPQIHSGRLKLLRLTRLLAAQREGSRVSEVLLRRQDGRVLRVQAPWFIDATDTGELLVQAEVPYRVGKEARAEFDEPDAPERADTLDQQPVTQVMALRWMPQATAAIAAVTPPPGYDFWRSHRPPQFQHLLFSPGLPGRGAGVSASLPFSGEGRTLDWWRYRRIVSGAQWTPARADVTLVNWAQNDYALHPLLDGPRPQAEVEAGARELSLCLLHWLQTEAPRPEGGFGYPEWQPACDVLGTPDGLAQQVYVRESRRIVGRDTLHQGELLKPPRQRADAVAIGWYNLDIHPTCVSGQGCNTPVQPFELALGHFIPAQGGNVIPACKNIAVTHLANACTRVHPVEWAVGEVAGLLAAQCHAQGWPDSAAQVLALQARLQTVGVLRHWPDELLARAQPSH